MSDFNFLIFKICDLAKEKYVENTISDLVYHVVSLNDGKYETI